MSDFHIVASLYAKEGREAEIRQKLIDVVEPSRRDDGNLAYELFVDRDDSRRFLFVEHWASPEAQRHHDQETDHIRRFQQSGADAVERVEFYKLDRLA